MSFRQWLQILFLQEWWRYNPRDTPWVFVPYHLFNLAEGAAWLVFAGLVLRRYATAQNSPWEIVYAAGFVTFGLTDFLEAYALHSWLLWLKLVNLIALLVLRHQVRTRYYPTSRLY